MLTLSRTIPQGGQPHTIGIAGKVRRMIAAGDDVVDLTAGDPDFPASRHIKEAAIKAIEANTNRYSPNQGLPELVQAIIKKFSTENHLQYEPGQILVSNGAKQCVFNALQAICNKGDEVVLIAPHCPDYPEMVQLAGAKPVVVSTSVEHGFTPDARHIRRAINQKTKAVLLNSPNNPSGAVYSRSLLEEIAAIAKDTGIFIISDELYEKLIFEEAKHCSIGSLKSVSNQVITINGCSMAFAIAGWRVGYMAGPQTVIDAVARLQSQATFGTNSIAQHAAIAALNGSTRDLDTMMAEFKRRRDFVVEKLSPLQDLRIILPQGTFFVFFGIEKVLGKKHDSQILKTSMDLATHLLDQHLVALGPGSAFGDDKCLRISLACPMPVLEKGINRVVEAFRRLAK